MYLEEPEECTELPMIPHYFISHEEPTHYHNPPINQPHLQAPLSSPTIIKLPLPLETIGPLTLPISHVQFHV